MEESHKTEPTIHKVSVWNFDASHSFFYLSCKKCKLYNKCRDEKRKQEVCEVAKKVEELFLKFIGGRVKGFVADDFFVDKKHNGSIWLAALEKKSNILRTMYFRSRQNVQE